MGDIVIRHRKHNAFTVGIVYFEQKGGAAKVLAVKDHQVLDSIVTVSAATMDSINLYFTNTSEAWAPINSVLDLNDDCLIQIFDMLPQSDILSVFDTCNRFRCVAKRALRKINLNTIEWRNITKVTRLFKMIGSAIISLNWRPISGFSAVKFNDIINLIAKYCISLKSLSIMCDHYYALSSLRPIIKNLESLNLELSDEIPDEDIVCDCTDLFSSCNRLVNLKIDCDSFNQEFFADAFENFHPQLESLNLYAEYVYYIPYKAFENILQNQNKLRDLRLEASGLVSETEYRKLFDILVRFCSNTLRSLYLRIKNTDELAVPLLQALFRNLESLSLRDWVIPPVHGLFARCQNVHTLKLFHLSNVCDATSEYDFPEVRHLVMRDLSDDISKQIRFIRNFEKIEKLSISVKTANPAGDTHKICAAIVGMKQVKNIRVLCDPIVNAENFSPLTKIEKIKKITVYNKDDYKPSVTWLMKGLVSFKSVEHLDLIHVTVNNRVIEAIGRLINLRQLNLVYNWCIIGRDSAKQLYLKPLETLTHLTVFRFKFDVELCDEELFDLMVKLTKLREIHFKCRNELGYKTYLKIIEMVNARKQLLTISSWVSEEMFKKEDNYLIGYPFSFIEIEKEQ